MTYRFTTREHAFSFVDHASERLYIVLGDDGRYWVTTPAQAARLVRAGYELAG